MWYLNYKLCLMVILLSIAVLGSINVTAQTAKEGYSRIQGVDKKVQKKSRAAEGLTIDFREEMRVFVQGISKFARSYRNNFIIIAGGGLELLVKRDEIDQTKTSPARTYLRSLDGVLQKGVFFSDRKKDEDFGSPTDVFEQEKMLKLLKVAKESGLKILTLEFSSEPSIIDKIEKLASARDFISSAVGMPFLDISQLPSYPIPPFKENASNILSLDMVKNFGTITNSAPFGRQDSFTLKMHETNFDMIAVEILHGRTPLSRRAVETLKYKKVGPRRLALAYMDVGTAASFQYYWQPGFQTGMPPWVSDPVPDDPDRYMVEYWRPQWQKIISGDTNSYIYGLVAQGFDGVILNGLDTYKFFEGDD